MKSSVAAEGSFTTIRSAAKDQVKAQFGSSSNELEGLGLKKKTEYDKPTKKKPTPKNSVAEARTLVRA